MLYTCYMINAVIIKNQKKIKKIKVLGKLSYGLSFSCNVVLTLIFKSFKDTLSFGRNIKKYVCLFVCLFVVVFCLLFVGFFFF